MRHRQTVWLDILINGLKKNGNTFSGKELRNHAGAGRTESPIALLILGIPKQKTDGSISGEFLTDAHHALPYCLAGGKVDGYRMGRIDQEDGRGFRFETFELERTWLRV